jgi:hypothetical protein
MEPTSSAAPIQNGKGVSVAAVSAQLDVSAVCTRAHIVQNIVRSESVMSSRSLNTARGGTAHHQPGDLSSGRAFANVCICQSVPCVCKVSVHDALHQSH